MAEIKLSARDRFALYVHINPQPVAGRAEQRKLDRLWSALALDPIAAVCEPKREGSRSTDFDDEKKPIELTSDMRDQLIDLLDRPMTGGLSRLLGPISAELIRARDGEAV